MGEKQTKPFQLSFNGLLKVDFQGSHVTSDGGLILVRELDERLGLGELMLILYGQIILTSPMIGIMMSLMRTTLTIDPDVERLLQHEIRRTDKSLKAVVNDALRLGLGMQGKPPRGSRYKVNPHPFAFKPGVDVDRLNQLVDELEADELARQRTR